MSPNCLGQDVTKRRGYHVLLKVNEKLLFYSLTKTFSLPENQYRKVVPSGYNTSYLTEYIIVDFIYKLIEYYLNKNQKQETNYSECEEIIL